MQKRTGTNALGVVSLAEETVDTTDWECKTSFGRAARKDEVSNLKLKCA